MCYNFHITNTSYVVESLHDLLLPFYSDNNSCRHHCVNYDNKLPG